MTSCVRDKVLLSPDEDRYEVTLKTSQVVVFTPAEIRSICRLSRQPFHLRHDESYVLLVDLRTEAERSRVTCSGRPTI